MKLRTLQTDKDKDQASMYLHFFPNSSDYNLVYDRYLHALTWHFVYRD